jgi:polyisoprenoid-binding protein YceI
MKRPIVGWVLGGVVVLAVAAVAYLYFAGGSGEPSTELTTPTISTEEEGMVAFAFDPARSSATFEIDEVLRGEPQRVVGTTSEIAGQFEVDPDDLSRVEFSQIVVNARTFDTGSGNRDRAIRGPVILDSASDEFEFITFDPTSVGGLQGSLAQGEMLEFTIEGDLAIRDTVNAVTFDVTATPTGESTIEGSAEATVLRSDYGIGIPNAPGVADVGDEVLIRLEFVATS